MSIAERNLTALKARHPAMIDRIPFDSEAPWQAHPAANGEMTVLHEGASGGRYIHSRFNPGADAAEWAGGIPGPGGPLIVLGFGLGYHARELMKDARFAPLMVIEADAALFGLALKLIDLQELLLNPKLIPIIGEDETAVREHLTPLCAQPFTFRLYHPVTALNASYYQPIRDFLDNSLFTVRRQTDPELGAGIRTLMETLAE